MIIQSIFLLLVHKYTIKHLIRYNTEWGIILPICGLLYQKSGWDLLSCSWWTYACLCFPVKGTLFKVQLPSSDFFLVAKGLSPGYSIWPIYSPPKPLSWLLPLVLARSKKFPKYLRKPWKMQYFSGKETCYRVKECCIR